MTVIGEAIISVKPDSAGFGPDTEKNVLGQVKGIAKKAAAIFGTAFVVTKGIDFFKSALGEAEESRKIAALTESVVKSTGAAANVSTKQISDLATSLSNVAGVDDEVIQGAENVLLTFTNVKNEVGKSNDIFNQATTAALDMSRALGTDLQGSTIQLGKALNDPIKGITALSRVGVSFTADQKEQIKTLVESGDTLAAQKVILKELSKEFGGAAKAAASPLERLQVTYSNLKETLGTPVIAVLGPLVTQLQGVLGKISPVFETIGNAIAPVFGVLGDVIGAVAGPLGDVAKILGGVFGEALKVIGPALQKVVKLLGPVFSSVLKALAPVLEHLVKAFMPLVGNIINALLDLLPPLVKVFTALLDAVLPILDAIAPLIPIVFEPLLLLIQPLLPLITALATVFADVLTPVIGALTPIIKVFADVLKAVVDFIVGAFSGNWSQAWDTILAVFKRVWEALSGIVSAVFNAIISIVKGAISGISSAISAVFGFIGDVWSKGWHGLTSVVSTVFNEVVGFVKGIPGRIISSLGNLAGILGKWFGDAFHHVVDVIGSVFSGVGDAITGVFKGAVNWILDKINWVIDKINWVTDKIPFIGSHLKIPHIPMLAYGAIIDKPTFSMIGEAGPEVVLPLSNTKRMIELLIAALQRTGNASGLLSLLAGAQIPKAATGGIVAPSIGGTLVTIAEAGRPEAIIPLPPGLLAALSNQPTTAGKQYSIDMSGAMIVSPEPERVPSAFLAGLDHAIWSAA